MGAEALSKRSRRDIRRAFSPEASAELFRFVEHCEASFDLKVAGVHNEIVDVRDTAANERAELSRRVGAFETLTFWPRLRWLLTGRLV